MKDRKLKQLLCAAYGGGQVKQALIAGEYPPPDVLPGLNYPTDLSADAENRALLQGSGVGRTITGRWTRETPPFIELYRTGPRSIKSQRYTAAGKLATVDFSKLEDRVFGLMAQKEKDDATE